MIAESVVYSLAAYLAFGAAFGIVFVAAGVHRLDKQAEGAGWGFRLLILPGVAALWPLLLSRWVRGKAPEEGEWI